MINENTVEHLYSPKDVTRVRGILLKQQEGIDPITGLVIPDKQSVLDHDHKTQYVRAVLHRQTNVLLGKIENAYIRYIAWWYQGTLPDLLRGCASYLETKHEQKYLHPAWIKHVQVQFNKLSEGSKKTVLECLGSEVGSNGKQRKDLFKRVVMRKEHSMKDLLTVIEKEMTK